MTTVTSWRTGRDLYLFNGFLRNGMQFQNGRLIVPFSGEYFVSSYVELYELCKEPNSTDLEKQEIKHALFKFSMEKGTDTEIAAKTYSRMVPSNGMFVYYASYISIFDHLNAGDEVSVRVSDISLLKYPDENVFGVNML